MNKATKTWTSSLSIGFKLEVKNNTLCFKFFWKFQVYFNTDIKDVTNQMENNGFQQLYRRSICKVFQSKQTAYTCI